MHNKNILTAVLVFTVIIFSGSVQAKTGSHGFFVAPGIVFPIENYNHNPSTGEPMDKYILQPGPSLAFSQAFKTKHTISLEGSLGFGGPTGALPLTWGAVGLAYQYGHFLTGWAIGPTVVLTGGVSLRGGIRISFWRLNLTVYGAPTQLFLAELNFSIGRLR